MSPLVLILDASAVLSVQQITSSILIDYNNEIDIQFLTTSEIINEIKDSISKLRIESLVASKELIIKSVSKEASEFIEKFSVKIGNNLKLSMQDKSILALAWDENNSKPKDQTVILLSDDYEILNTAKIMKIKFKPVRTKGIRYSAKFYKICFACGNKVQMEDTDCDNCGSLKFKTKKIPYRNK